LGGWDTGEGSEEEDREGRLVEELARGLAGTRRKLMAARVDSSRQAEVVKQLQVRG